MSAEYKTECSQIRGIAPITVIAIAIAPAPKNGSRLFGMSAFHSVCSRSMILGFSVGRFTKVAPTFAALDARYGRLRNSEVESYLFVRADGVADHENLLIRKLSVRLELAALDCIKSVVTLCAQLQMLWIYAYFVVASMSDQDAFWDRAFVNFVRNSMGAQDARPIGNDPIAKRGCARPMPASAGHPFDEWGEAFGNRHLRRPILLLGWKPSKVALRIASIIVTFAETSCRHLISANQTPHGSPLAWELPYAYGRIITSA